MKYLTIRITSINRLIIVYGAGGVTGIHENSFVINNDCLFICCSNEIFSLRLPDLLLNWEKELDWATCLGIHKFEDDLVIHGELQVTRLDKEGTVKWSFGARDIFVTQDERSSFEIDDNKIKLIDWQGYKYILNFKGEVI